MQDILYVAYKGLLIVRILFKATSHHAVGGTSGLNVFFLGFEILLKKDNNAAGFLDSIKSKG